MFKAPKDNKNLANIEKIKEKQAINKEYLRNLESSLKELNKHNSKDQIKKTKKLTHIHKNSIENYIMSKNLDDSNNYVSMKISRTLTNNLSENKIKTSNKPVAYNKNKNTTNVRLKDYLNNRLGNSEKETELDNLKKSLGNQDLNKKRNKSEAEIQVYNSQTNFTPNFKNKSYSNYFKTGNNEDYSLKNMTNISIEGNDQEESYVVNTSMNFQNNNQSRGMNDSEIYIKNEMMPLKKNHNDMDNEGEEEQELFQESKNVLSNSSYDFSNASKKSPFKRNHSLGAKNKIKKGADLSGEINNEYDKVTLQKLVILKNILHEFKSKSNIYENLENDVQKIYKQYFCENIKGDKKGKLSGSRIQVASKNNSRLNTSNNQVYTNESDNLKKEIINLKQKMLVLEKKNDLINKENLYLKEIIKNKFVDISEIKYFNENKKKNVDKLYNKYNTNNKENVSKIQELESLRDESLTNQDKDNNYINLPRQVNPQLRYGKNQEKFEQEYSSNNKDPDWRNTLKNKNNFESETEVFDNDALNSVKREIHGEVFQKNPKLIKGLSGSNDDDNYSNEKSVESVKNEKKINSKLKNSRNIEEIENYDSNLSFASVKYNKSEEN